MAQDNKKNKCVALIILDGWGVAPPTRGNAISLAPTPVMDNLIKSYASTTLHASGELVGLPWGEMGNSEVGHMNLGGGKIVYQSLPLINKAISDGSFFKNEKFLQAIKHAKKHQVKLHLMGLVSAGGVHSFDSHLHALLELCRNEKFKDVYIHAFLDGRDTPRDSGLNFITKLQAKMDELKIGQIASLSGRYYAMDRNNHWERTKQAYLAIVEGKAEKKYENPITAIEESYKKEEFDEEFIPAVVTKKGQPITKVDNNDAVIFFNFRADRARQITKAIILPGFEKFARPRQLKNLFFVTMMEYESDLPVEIAFLKGLIQEPLSKIIADAGHKQLHIAETTKYAHVTFYFNGGVETPFPGEERVLVPSVSVSSFDQRPEMSAREVKEKVIHGLSSRKYQFIVVNFANPDMVGHTGNLPAAIKAISVVDKCVGEIVETALAVEAPLLITADHGNAEEMLNLQTGEIIKEHSTNPVPLVLVGSEWTKKSSRSSSDNILNDLCRVRPAGALSDVAPTILDILAVKKPDEMTGISLFGRF